MQQDIVILIISCILIVVGISLIIRLGYKNGMLDFLGPNQWWALFLILVAGITTWLGMTLVVSTGDKLKITNKQWVALGFSLVISILWWARYVYIVSDEETFGDSK